MSWRQDPSSVKQISDGKQVMQKHLSLSKTGRSEFISPILRRARQMPRRKSFKVSMFSISPARNSLPAWIGPVFVWTPALLSRYPQAADNASCYLLRRQNHRLSSVMENSLKRSCSNSEKRRSRTIISQVQILGIKWASCSIPAITN